MPNPPLVDYLLEQRLICPRDTSRLIVSRDDKQFWLHRLRNLLVVSFRAQGDGGPFQPHGTSQLYRIRMSFIFIKGQTICPLEWKHKCAPYTYWLAERWQFGCMSA